MFGGETHSDVISPLKWSHPLGGARQLLVVHMHFPQYIQRKNYASNQKKQLRLHHNLGRTLRWTVLVLAVGTKKNKRFLCSWGPPFFSAIWEREDFSSIGQAEGWWYQHREHLPEAAICPAAPVLHLHTSFSRSMLHHHLAGCQPERSWLQMRRLWGISTCADIHLAAESREMLLPFTQAMTEQLTAVQCYQTHTARCQLVISHIFSPTSPLLTPYQLASPFLTAGWSHFISCWLYSSCLDTTQFLLFLIMHFLAWSPLETSSSDNIRWPFLYYFPMVLFSPW